ncbi:hypothetical protein ACFQX7_07120 [Luedemannella flava]
MADVEIMARVGVGGGAPVERLVCHPRLPFVAGLSSARPMVHVWGCEGGELRELGTVGGDAADYDDVVGWERITRTPGVAWHPDEPLLLVASEGTVTRWTPQASPRSTASHPPPRTAAWRSARTVGRCGRCRRRRTPRTTTTTGAPPTRSTSGRGRSRPPGGGTPGSPRIPAAVSCSPTAATRARRSASSRGSRRMVPCAPCAER